MQSLTDDHAWNFDGEITCDVANENLEKWDSTLKSEQIPDVLTLSIKQLCLRGTILRNTEYIYGIPIYLGNDTKIMKNQKKQPHKVSNVMRQMNTMLF